MIDKAAGRLAPCYFVAMTKDSSGHYHQRLHALDLRTGAELFGGPTEIRPVSRHRRRQPERLRHLQPWAVRRTRRHSGVRHHALPRIYVALRHSALHRMDHGLQRAHPPADVGDRRHAERQRRCDLDGRLGTGGGFAGNIYFLDGNGTFDTTLDVNGFPVNGDYGNAFMKLSTSVGHAAGGRTTSTCSTRCRSPMPMRTWAPAA